jgi:hypothetical protein
MNYTLIKDFIDLLQEFENEVQICPDLYPGTVQGFKAWISDKENTNREIIPKNPTGKVRKMEERRKVQ